MRRIKKGLFVTHDVSLYGASRSLQTLLGGLEDTDIDMVLKKRLRGSRDLKEVNKFFHNKAQQIKEFYLPHPNIYKGSEWKEYIVKINDFCWKSNARFFYNFVQKNNYDFIHLNSIVLHQLIREDLPFFIHVREIFNNQDPAVLDSLKKARGVIFIDEATEQPFKSLGLTNSTILNNPFDMRHLQEMNADLIRSTYDLKGKAVFSIIGNIAPIKGVSIAIKSFKKISNPNAVMFIVGNSNNEAYLNSCKELAGGDPRIIFYGEEPEIGKIYAISDYILRCDPQFCVGRTVYEGLYAGCHVILPGHEHDRGALFEVGAFNKSIALYPPQDINALATLIEEKSKSKILNRNFSSNITSHLEQFNEFILSKIEEVRS